VTARAARLVVAPVAVAGAALVTVAVVRQEPGWSLVGESGWRLAIELLAALALAAAGVVVQVRGPDPRSGTLLSVVAAAWLTAEWNSPGALGPLVFTTGLLVGALAPAVVAHALLAHGRGRLTDAPERLAVAGAYLSSALLLGLASTALFDPRAQGCSSCPANVALLVDAPSVADWLQRFGLRLGAATLAAAAVLALVRLAGSSVARRRAVAPVVVPAVAFLGIVVAHYVHDLLRGFPSTDAVDQALRLAEAGALLGIAAGVAWQRLAAQRIRGRLARVVVEMAAAARPGGLRTLLADALEDPTLDILYAAQDGWIDATGRARALAEERDRARTALVQDGEVVAIVTHRRGLLDDPSFVEELGRAARLALDHERLQAQLRAQIERLRLSRTAIVAAADGERRRLERDLHDGAQTGLAGLAMAIGLARSAGDTETAARMGTAQDRVRTALDQVRTLAHSLHPAALSDAGLAAALDVLAEWRPHVELGELPDRRFDPTVEAGAYFIVAALTQSPAAAAVSASGVSGRLVVEVRTSQPGDLTDVEDRVGALGGRLAVLPTPEGDTLVRAELACAS
jgi:signal transduction histidine kinase